MTTSAPTIIDDTVLLAHQAVTHPGSVLDAAAVGVETLWKVQIDLSAGFSEAAANTNPGKFIIQSSTRSSGDEDWHDIFEAEIDESGTPADEALTATEPLTETELAVASTTGFVALDDIYILHTTLGSSEWAKIKEISAGASVTITHGLTNEQTAAASTIFGSAFRRSIVLDVMAASRIRCLFMHEGAAGANMHVKAEISSVTVITHT